MGYFDKFKREGIWFMDDAEKGDLNELVGTEVIIEDWAYLDGDNGKFAVLKLADHDGVFYFGNKVITDILTTVDEDGAQDAVHSTPVKITKRTTKEPVKGKLRDYFAWEFQEQG